MEVATIFRFFDVPETMLADKNKVISFLYESTTPSTIHDSES